MAVLAAMMVAVAVAVAVDSAIAVQRNIVHIIVDDLRSELGAYGLPHRHTPNLDRLAAGGTVFDRACKAPHPPKTSFLLPWCSPIVTPWLLARCIRVHTSR